MTIVLLAIILYTVLVDTIAGLGILWVLLCGYLAYKLIRSW